MIRTCLLIVGGITLVSCAASPNGFPEALLTAPGGYENYSCAALYYRIVATEKRLSELATLDRKAGDSWDGRLVAATTYQSEIIAKRGEVNSLKAAQKERGCDNRTYPLPATPTLNPR